MNYEKLYFSIIENAKAQLRSKKVGYFENHHILPESLGGVNAAENRVLLTAREHLLCHRLLVRMLEWGTAEWRSMVFAFKRMMDCGRNNSERALSLTPRLYEERRKLHSAATSQFMIGKPKSEAARRKMSLAKRGISLSTEHRSKIAASLSRSLADPDHKEKMSKNRKGRSMPSNPESIARRKLGHQKMVETKLRVKSLSSCHHEFVG